MVHDRIPHQGELEDVVTLHPGLGDQLTDQVVDRLADHCGELRRPVLVHHDVGDPAHQVLTEPDLGVHPPGRGENGAGGEVTEMTGDGRGADVEGHAEHQIAESGPDPDHFSLVADRHRHLPLPLSERRLQPVQDRWVEPRAHQGRH